MQEDEVVAVLVIGYVVVSMVAGRIAYVRFQQEVRAGDDFILWTMAAVWWPVSLVCWLVYLLFKHTVFRPTRLDREEKARKAARLVTESLAKLEKEFGLPSTSENPQPAEVSSDAEAAYIRGDISVEQFRSGLRAIDRYNETKPAGSPPAREIMRKVWF